jgi:regulator of replication initiation timing
MMTTTTLFEELQTAVKQLLVKNQRLQQELTTLKEQHELVQLELMEKEEQQIQVEQQVRQLLAELAPNNG